MFHKSVMGRGVATPEQDVTLSDYIARKQDKPKLTFKEWWDAEGEGIMDDEPPITAHYVALQAWKAGQENV